MKKDFFWKRKKTDGSSEQGKNERFERFAETFTNYFTTEPEKQRVLRHEDFDAAGDTYYATVSARYKIGQRIFLTLFVIFSIVSITANFKHITYDNLFFLVKDFNTAVDTENVNYETLSYDSSADQSFALYRGGLSVVSRTNVSAFTATGRRTLNSNTALSKPIAVASDKYLLVYDIGGNSFSLYNSFAKIYSETLDYPITDACFDGRGGFAILTRSPEYESQVIIYDSDFDRRVSCSKNKFAFDISLDEKGERLAVIYAGTDDGIANTELAFFDAEKGEKIGEYLYVGELPIACSFLESGSFAVITDSCVRTYKKDLSEDGTSKSYADKKVCAVWSDESYVALAINDGIVTDVSEIFVFDKKCRLVYNNVIRYAVDQLAVCDGHIFVKNNAGVVRINIKNSDKQELRCQNGRMLIYDGSTALVCAQSKAVYLKFDN